MHTDKRPLIIAIVGKSGSGKTTFAKMLECLGIPQIVSYTTRAKRDDETDGVEHWFVDDSQVPSLTETMAYTYFGGKHYWTLLEQLKHPVQSYVIDEVGLEKLMNSVHEIADVMIVDIRRDFIDVDKERQSRDAERIELDKFDCIIDNNGTLKELQEKAQHFAARHRSIYDMHHPKY